MRLYKFTAGLLAGGILLSSCTANFDDINTNPDGMTQVTPALLATSAIMGIVRPNSNKSFIQHMLTTKHMAWYELLEESTQYNNFGRDGFGIYPTLRNYTAMEELAVETYQDQKIVSAYKGLALFLKAYRLFNLTISVGDIPYENILMGADGPEYLTGPYNTQKDVFRFLIRDLDQAHQYFVEAGGATFEGDPVLDGNSAHWDRVCNTFELRVLSMLSMKEDDPDLNVKAKYAEVAGRDLLQSNDDNLQLEFSSKEGQIYPFNETLQSYKQYAMVSTTVVDVLKEYGDYRLFYYARPSDKRVEEGMPADSWDAYVGTDPSDPFEDIMDKANSRDFSILNDRYTDASNPAGEPFITIGYAELCFNLAEAALRGWIQAEPSAYYKAGIEASMRFAADHTPDDANYHHNRQITDEVIASTLDNPAIQLTGDFDHDLYLIMEQKYLAGFMQIPYLTYYDYRRTGCPEFPINPESNRNVFAPDKMPMRWMYPQDEYDYNKANIEEAVQRQFGGSDDINQLMWIVKE